MSVVYKPNVKIFGLALNFFFVFLNFYREENIKQTILLKQQEITDINSRVAELNRKMDEIKKRKQIFATRNEEKNRINLNLKRARTQVDGIKKTLKDPAAIYAEAEKEREVSCLKLNFFVMKSVIGT